MTTAALECALAYARRGWSVFPISPGSKRPPAGLAWKDASTTDADQIRAFAANYPGCNFALDCGKSSVLVLDIDDKEGRRPLDRLRDFTDQLGSELPATLTVVTRAGGYHLYYTGVARSTTGAMMKGVDTRGTGGYVLIPGSFVEADATGPAGTYSVVGKRLPVALPAALSDAIARAARDHSADPERDVPLVELDKPENYALALTYAKAAPPSVEGDGGNNNAYKVIARLRDYGMSSDTALQLLYESGWNDRCQPSWGHAELTALVEHAYEYAQKRAGSATPAVAFDDAEDAETKASIEALEKAVAQQQRQEQAEPRAPQVILPASSIVPAELPKRQWVLGRMLIAGYVTVLTSRGGVGKSTLLLMAAAAISSGKGDLVGEEVHRQGATWVYNTEDPLCEMQLRTAAMAQQHSIPMPELSNLFLSSGQEHPLVLVEEAPGGVPVFRKNTINSVVECIRDNKIVAMFTDPFVRTHRIDENNNMAVDLVAQAWTQIARRTGCAICIAHHIRKAKPGQAADMDDARGASALMNAARIGYGMTTVSPKECQRYGLPAADANWYIRLEPTKANMGAPGKGVRWFRRISEVLPNGEPVGALRRIEVTEVEETPIVQAIMDLVSQYPEGSRTSVNEVASKAALDSLWVAQAFGPQGASASTIRRKITEVVGEGLSHDGRLFAIKPERLGGRVVNMLCVVDDIYDSQDGQP